MKVEKYRQITGQYEALSNELERKALEIANSQVRGEVYRIRSYGPELVEFEYNGSCGCHPDTDIESFLAELLFRE